MYTTCLFCQKPLGANESIEASPIGRRVAFDSAKGRLWVVCRQSERWNLAPFDARWEALEQCERAYRDTRRAAEELAGIADRLATPPEIERRLDDLRRGQD